MRPHRQPMEVGDEAEVEIGPMAHGGHAIAHHAGRTLLVRHAIPGERVRIRITEVRSKIARADAIEVLTASRDRVEPPCPWAGPDRCGGCDFQHVGIERQRTLKAGIIEEALRRARVWDHPVTVEPVPGDADGLHWRTRVRWTVDPSGRAGLLAHRSHRVVPVGDCLIAGDGIAARITSRSWPGENEIRSAEGSDGSVGIWASGRHLEGPSRVTEEVLGRRWRLSAETFWQVHPGAAGALVQCVMELGQPRQGEHWWDLYAGAGLFSAFLGGAVGASGCIDAVEASGSAVRDARRSLHDLPQVRLHHSRVDEWLGGAGVDGVVLDPPRTGARPEVLARIAQAMPRVIVYVACDPIALARDLATLSDAGYRVRAVQGFDTFPMTHHVETVAALVPQESAHQIS